MKHLKLFEAKVKYSGKEVNNFKKITEFCEEYVADIIDDCKSRSIITSATSEDDVIKLNHYTNLQPLCSYTNRYIKKDTIYNSPLEKQSC
jgi:hypothetical protein